MPLIDSQARDRVRELNDAFRRSLDPNLGKIVLTAGVAALLSDARAKAIRKLATFDPFGADNDPHGQHDFGSFEVGGNRFFFKMDFYDPSLKMGSGDPADPAKTTRVLTLMLAQEY